MFLRNYGKEIIKKILCFHPPKKLHNLFVLINVEYGTYDKEYVLLYFKPFDHSTIQTKKVILKKIFEACKTKNSKNTRFHFFFFSRRNFVTHLHFLSHLRRRHHHHHRRLLLLLPEVSRFHPLYFRLFTFTPSQYSLNPI